MRHSTRPLAATRKSTGRQLSKRIGHADVAFTMKQYVQTSLDADRQVANTLADLMIGLLTTGLRCLDRSNKRYLATGEQ